MVIFFDYFLRGFGHRFEVNLWRFLGSLLCTLPALIVYWNRCISPPTDYVNRVTKVTQAKKAMRLTLCISNWDKCFVYYISRFCMLMHGRRSPHFSWNWKISSSLVFVNHNNYVNGRSWRAPVSSDAIEVHVERQLAYAFSFNRGLPLACLVVLFTVRDPSGLHQHATYALQNCILNYANRSYIQTRTYGQGICSCIFTQVYSGLRCFVFLLGLIPLGLWGTANPFCTICWSYVEKNQ